MALVIIAMLAAQQESAVHSLRQGILDPDYVDGTEAPHRNQADIRRIGKFVQRCDVQSRQGVVLADQSSYNFV